MGQEREDRRKEGRRKEARQGETYGMESDLVAVDDDVVADRPCFGTEEGRGRGVWSNPFGDTRARAGRKQWRNLIGRSG